MEIVIRPDSRSVAELGAEMLAHDLRQKPGLVIGMDGGKAIEEVCSILVRMHRDNALDFSRCRLFAVAEYVGCSIKKPSSRCHCLWSELISRVNADSNNFHSPNGMAENLDEECESYEEIIYKCGGIDVQVLTIGSAGNLGFNEPLSSLMSRTHATPLSPLLADADRSIGAGHGEIPLYGITMGMGTIMDAMRCIVLVCGRDRAEFLAKALEGPITSMISASTLQMHPRCTVIVDELAGTRLQGADYYRWMFAHDRKWDEYR